MEIKGIDKRPTVTLVFQGRADKKEVSRTFTVFADDVITVYQVVDKYVKEKLVSSDEKANNYHDRIRFFDGFRKEGVSITGKYKVPINPIELHDDVKQAILDGEIK